jgi:ribosomal protein S6
MEVMGRRILFKDVQDHSHGLRCMSNFFLKKNIQTDIERSTETQMFLTDRSMETLNVPHRLLDGNF